MAALEQSMKFNVRLAWWLMPYLRGVRCMCMLTGMPPDMDRVSRVIRRAVRVEPAKRR